VIATTSRRIGGEGGGMSHLFGSRLDRPVLLLAAAVAALLALYVGAVDQGQVLAFVQGQVAFEQNLLHELVHDARHVAGFPCH
jgi:Probable cobalt transporter subunit (CbtB)